MTFEELSFPRLGNVEDEQSISSGEEAKALDQIRPAPVTGPGLEIIGWLMFVLGLCSMGYAMFGYDPSVESSSSDAFGASRINNTGLLNRQLMIFIGGGAFIISGAVMGSVARLVAIVHKNGGAEQ